jgi:predicted phage-related endonuclease
MTTPTMGASELAGILGLSKWTTPFKIWGPLMGLVPRYDESGGNVSTTRGKRLEPALGMWYAEDTGHVVTPGPKLTETPLVHTKYPWLHGRPDFLVPAAKKTLECKTTKYLMENDGWGEANTDLVPKYYAIQVVVQMAVAFDHFGYEEADLAALGTVYDDFRIYHFRRNVKLEDAIINRAGEWYERHIVKGEMPPVDSTEDCSRFLAKVFPGRPEKLFVQATAEDIAIAAKAAALRANIAEQQSQLDAIYNEIRLKIGDNYGLKDGKATIATWGLRKGAARFATARFKKDFPDLAKAYEEIGEDGRTFKFTYTGEEE